MPSSFIIGPDDVFAIRRRSSAIIKNLPKVLFIIPMLLAGFVIVSGYLTVHAW